VTQLRVALERFGKQIVVLRQQKQDVEQAIDELTRTMAIVSGMLRDREAQESGEVAREAAE
jgi:hypothetical protein